MQEPGDEKDWRGGTCGLLRRGQRTTAVEYIAAVPQKRK
jgi:hypothetical protein